MSTPTPSARNSGLRALILAAGRGERMRPLSDALPKPLLPVGGKPLIGWQLEALARAGIRQVVINLAHLGALLRERLGDGARYGVSIRYAIEGSTPADALETRGGIVHALPLLGDAPFVVTSGDIVTGFDYATLAARADAIARGEMAAHLVLVDDPRSNPGGDMGVRNGRATREPPRLTYANIAVLSPALFDGVEAARAKLFPWFYRFVDAGMVTAERFGGDWHNVGTPDELADLDRRNGVHGP